MWICNLSFLSLAKFWMFMESFLPPINIRRLWRNRHIGYTHVLVEQLRASSCFVVFWNKTLTIFKWFCCREKLLWVYVLGRYLGLGKCSYNANEWIPTQKSLSDIVEYALIMLWREKEEQITNEPWHDKTDKVSVRSAKTQISLGIRPVWSESSLSAWRMLGSLATHWTLSEDSDQPGHPPSLIRVFAVRMKNAWVLRYPLNALRRVWSDWADAQADLSLRWAHTQFVGFVILRLKWNFILSQCVRDKSFIARKPEVHSIFRGKKLFKNVTFRILNLISVS